MPRVPARRPAANAARCSSAQGDWCDGARLPAGPPGYRRIAFAVSGRMSANPAPRLAAAAASGAAGDITFPDVPALPATIAPVACYPATRAPRGGQPAVRPGSARRQSSDTPASASAAGTAGLRAASAYFFCSAASDRA